MNKNTLQFAFLNGTIWGIVNIMLVWMLILWVLKMNLWIDPEVVLMISGFAWLIVFIILLHIFSSVLSKHVKSDHKNIVWFSTLIFAVYYIFSYLTVGWELIWIGIYLVLFYWVSNSNIKASQSNTTPQEKVIVED